MEKKKLSLRKPRVLWILMLFLLMLLWLLVLSNFSKPEFVGSFVSTTLITVFCLGLRCWLWKKDNSNALYIQDECSYCGNPQMVVIRDNERASFKTWSTLGPLRQITLKRIIAQCPKCKAKFHKAEEVEVKYDNFDPDVPIYPKVKDWTV